MPSTGLTQLPSSRRFPHPLTFDGDQIPSMPVLLLTDKPQPDDDAVCRVSVLNRTFRADSGRRMATQLIMVAALVVSGCQNEPPIREYEIDSEIDRVMTSDVLRDEFGAIPFQWDAPASWTVAQNDQFSKVAWQTGPKGSEARITLSDLPIAAGMVPQLTRWRGQIGLTQESDANPMDGTEQLKLPTGAGTYVDFQGDEETILGMLVPQGSKLWVFKFRGSNEVADQQRAPFRKFCESVRVPATQGDK